MTVNEVRTCEPTLEAWQRMIAANVQAEQPATVEEAVDLAVAKTLFAVWMRQTICGDAAAAVKQINQSNERET